MTTARQIVTRALSELGVLGSGDTLDAGDAQKGLDALNDLAGSWNTSPLYAYATADSTASVSPGQSFVTVGVGQQISVAGLSRIEQGAFYRVGNIDYPVRVIRQSEYASIWNKDIATGWPSYAYYDRAGKIHLWPVPGAGGELHLPIRGRLSSFTTLDTNYTLPDGYDRALSLSLAEELADQFQRPVSMNLIRRALGARTVIKRANLVVPTLDAGFRSGAFGLAMAQEVIDGGAAQGGILVGDGDFLIYT